MTDDDSKEATIDGLKFVDGQPIASDWNGFLKPRNDEKRLFSVDLAVRETALLSAQLHTLKWRWKPGTEH